MRNAFAQQITALGERDPRVVLLSGDIGNRLFDEFKAACPDRFYNCGVAEANMIGVAAGLALNGLRPFCYTIAPFVTYRCMEQIRVDVCYHHVPVTIVGTGAGLAYASLGATHHSCEEMGMLRLLPGMTVLAPADEWEVRAAVKAALNQPHPVYIRLGKKGEPVIHAAEPEFSIGKAIPMRPGDDVCILAAGTILPIALHAADVLGQRGISTAVYSAHSIKPLDTELLTAVFARFQLVATVEEHSILGGLGGAVAEWAAELPAPRPRHLRFGTADEFLHETCEQEDAREHFGLSAVAIAERLAKALSA
ncbi:MAG: transketolase [Pedosphaera sp.]|nr:transketolase [Pedosphaera sp.]